MGKDSKKEILELETSLNDAFVQAENATKALDVNTSVLKEVKEDKDEAYELLAQQDADLTLKAKAEERLTALYDNAIEALSRERVDQHAFNTAVLKTHWVTCKLHEAMK